MDVEDAEASKIWSQDTEESAMVQFDCKSNLTERCMFEAMH